MNSDFPKRKKTRWEGYDYNSAGAYFITICTQNRQQILSRVVGGDVLDAPVNISSVGGDVLDAPVNISSVGGDVLDAPQIVLLHHGKIADNYLRQLSDFYDYLEVDQYVIMPNHIHIMLFVFEHESISSTAKQHTAMSRFVSTFKRFCNKEYGENIWQRGCIDHVIRNRQDYQEHLKYIYENPARWYYDELFGD